MDGEVICCFCGLWLSSKKSVKMVVFPTELRDESQTVYCHKTCLRQHLSPRVPYHPDLDEEDSDEA